jgi:hypothetical protein
MAQDIKIKNDGDGSDIGAHVDQNNQLHVRSITKSTVQDATSKGNSYNINTGTIGLTSTSESAVLYLKNNESPVNGESTIVVDAIAVGLGVGDTGVTLDEKTVITVVKNPTAGTIVAGAVAVDMKENRNFGSSNELDSSTLVYKGAEGNTFTDGDDFAQFYQDSVRGYYPIDVEIPKGSSLGIKMNTQTSAGTTDVYVALIMHRKDGSNN